MSGGPAHDLERAEILYDAETLDGAVHRLAGELLDAQGPDLVLVAVLNSALVFCADLVRALTTRGGHGVLVDAVGISAYEAGQPRVRVEKDLDLDVADRPVVLVEGIVDTALSLAFLRDHLARRGPRSLAVCALFDKPARRILPTPLDHVGFEAPDRFLLGYGLDYQGRYRNLPVVAAGDRDTLADDPDCYVSQLYGGSTGRRAASSG